MENISTRLIPDIQETLKKLYGDKNSDNLSKLGKDQKKIIIGLIEWENVLSGGTHKDLNDYGKSTMTDLGKRLNTKFKKLTEILEKEEIEVNIALL